MSTVILTASDAGGGDSIFPLFDSLVERDHMVYAIIGGTARDVWRRSGYDHTDGDTLSEASLDELLRGYTPDLIVCGTSAGSTIEKKLIAWAKNNRTPTLSVLDAWGNYWQRFSSSEKDFKYLTDVVCVMDDTARKDMVGEGFDESVLQVTGNPHFDHFADGITVGSENRERILFVSQPLSEGSRGTNLTDYGYDEVGVLSDVVSVLRKMSYSYELLVRPHPKEKRDAALKFSALIGDRVQISEEEDPDRDVSRSGLVVGMHSELLFRAAVAGKRVVSYQPNLKLEERDPLVTNRRGETQFTYDARELPGILEAYFRGTMEAPSVTLPKGATENVMRVIEEILQKK